MFRGLYSVDYSLKLPAWKVGIEGSNPALTFIYQRNKMYFSLLIHKYSILWGGRGGGVSSHHPQEVFMAQFSLYVHKGVLKSPPIIHVFVSSELPMDL